MRDRLDRAARADRHEAGVSTAPCGVVSTPRRAAPSVCVKRVNPNASAILCMLSPDVLLF